MPSAKTVDRPGVEARFERVFRANLKFVWRVLRCLGVQESEVADAAQEVFMVVARKMREIEADKERSYVFGTSVRVAARARRRQYRRGAAEVPRQACISEQADRSADPEHATVLRQRTELLDQVLSHMTQEHREVLVLSMVEQLSRHEIADALGIPPGTVASRQRRGLAAFRKLAAEHAGRDLAGSA